MQLLELMSSWELNWGDIGQLLGGFSSMVIAIYGGIVATRLTRRQNRKQWVDDFHTIYAEFWNDSDNAEVRRWISSRQLYNEFLKPVLVLRNQQNENDLDKDDSIKIEKIDKFIAILVRFQVAEKMGMPRHEHEFVQRLLFSEYWINQINKRSELYKYADKNWHGELDLTEAHQLDRLHGNHYTTSTLWGIRRLF